MKSVLVSEFGVNFDYWIYVIFTLSRYTVNVHEMSKENCRLPGPETIKKSGAWIGAQLTILCSINRKLRSGYYKEIGVRFLCSV